MGGGENRLRVWTVWCLLGISSHKITKYDKYWLFKLFRFPFSGGDFFRGARNISVFVPGSSHHQSI